MDPDATLAAIFACCEMGAPITARENIEDLIGWLDKGGRMPDIDRVRLRALLHYLRRAVLTQENV